MSRVDYFFARVRSMQPSASAKKSFSSASCPIFARSTVPLTCPAVHTAMSDGLLTREMRTRSNLMQKELIEFPCPRTESGHFVFPIAGVVRNRKQPPQLISQSTQH